MLSRIKRSETDMVFDAERKAGCLTNVIQPTKSNSANEIRRFDLSKI